MALATIGAIESTVRASKRLSDVIGRVFVSTTSRIGPFFSRSTAGPESRAWVATIETESAPRVVSSSAALTTVPGGVDHVVDEQALPALDLTDDLFGHGHVVGALGPALVDEREVGVDVVLLEAVREPAGELAAAGIRRDDRDPDARVELVGHVVGEQRHRGEVVDREVEEALDLTGVQVDRHDAVRARDGEHVGEQPRGDRLAALGLPVLTRVPVERADRGDALRRRALRRVDHDQLLHDPVVDRIAEALQHEHVGAADVLAVAAVELAVRERATA